MRALYQRGRCPEAVPTVGINVETVIAHGGEGAKRLISWTAK
jgi:hypothetical protein